MKNTVKKIFQKSTLISLLAIAPLNLCFGLEIGVNKQTTFGQVIEYLVGIIYQVIPILVIIAFILFFWGLSKFVINASNEKELQAGKEYMLWGILALFILISIRSILTIIASDVFNNKATSAPLLPGGGSDTTIKFKPSESIPVLPTTQ